MLFGVSGLLLLLLLCPLIHTHWVGAKGKLPFPVHGHVPRLRAGPRVHDGDWVVATALSLFFY